MSYLWWPVPRYILRGEREEMPVKRYPIEKNINTPNNLLNTPMAVEFVEGSAA